MGEKEGIREKRKNGSDKEGRKEKEGRMERREVESRMPLRLYCSVTTH